MWQGTLEGFKQEYNLYKTERKTLLQIPEEYFANESHICKFKSENNS